MQYQIFRQISKLLGGMLPAFVVPPRKSHVLDIGWCIGESVHELALKYPSSHITGIDMNESIVEQARSLVREFHTVAFFVGDFQHLDDTVLIPATFDLIHLHFLAGKISLQQFPPFLLSLSRISQPGGLLVWTEGELPITTSLACQRLCTLILQVLQASGHALSQGNSLGLTAQMSSMLGDAGYRCTYSKAYAIDISTGSKGNNAFISQLRISYSQIRAFLLERGLTTVSEFEDLYMEMQQEVQEEQFCGLLYMRRVVASRL